MIFLVRTGGGVQSSKDVRAKGHSHVRWKNDPETTAERQSILLDIGKGWRNSGKSNLLHDPVKQE